jgi:hypothetical protein
MNKANGVCFLVKKKRFRRPVEAKKRPIDENEGHKVQQNYESKRERSFGDNPNQNINFYKVLECKENRIILIKASKKTKNIQNVKTKMTDEENLLDFDRFLDEYFKSENEGAQSTPQKQKPLKTHITNKPKCKGNFTIKNKVFR